MANKLKFPENFLWGSATAGPQIESKVEGDSIGVNIWEHWHSIEPEQFFDQRYVENNFQKNWQQDIQIAADLNFNSIRVGVAFSRIFPNGMDEVNQDGVDFYNKVFDYVKEKGLELIVTMYHFDTPLWLQELGGWNFKEVHNYFYKYAKFLAKEYKQVDYWVTMNEPIVPIEGGYWSQFHYPALESFQGGLEALNLTAKSHLMMMKAIREETDKKTGVVISIEPGISRSESEEDMTATYFGDYFRWRYFTDLMLNLSYPMEFIEKVKASGKGEIPVDPEMQELIKDSNLKADFVGVNFYRPIRTMANENPKEGTIIRPNDYFFQEYLPTDVRFNKHRGWEIHPQSIYNILMELKNNYDNIPVYISENGMGVEDEGRFRDENGQIQDDYRIAFINEHLEWAHKAIEEGSALFGYHMWTYIDNWSWRNAYKNRYGYIELDIETGERREKKSASWIRKVIKENAIDLDDNNPDAIS